MANSTTIPIMYFIQKDKSLLQKLNTAKRKQKAYLRGSLRLRSYPVKQRQIHKRALTKSKNRFKQIIKMKEKKS